MAEANPGNDSSDGDVQDIIERFPAAHVTQHIHYHAPVYKQKGDVVKTKASVKGSNIERIGDSAKSHKGLMEGGFGPMAILGPAQRSPEQGTGIRALPPPPVQAGFLSREQVDARQGPQMIAETFGQGGGRSIKDEFKRIQLEVESSNLVNQSKFSEALILLQQLQQLQTDEWGKLHTLILMTECDVMCDNHRLAVKNMERIIELITSLRPTTDDVIAMGQHYKDNKQCFRSIVLFYSACKLFQSNARGDEAVKRMITCAEYVRDVVAVMMKRDKNMKKIVIGHVIPILREVADDVSKVQVSQHKVRIEHQGWCSYYIATCYYFCGEHQQAINMLESAIDSMKRELGEDAEKYRLFGFCHFDCGVAYYDMQKLVLTAEKSRECIRAWNRATDWPSEEVKKELIGHATNLLRFVNEELNK